MMPDLHVQIVDSLAEGDKVMVRTSRPAPTGTGQRMELQCSCCSASPTARSSSVGRASSEIPPHRPWPLSGSFPRKRCSGHARFLTAAT
ncbi:MAG: hypothetical protein JWR37_3528 [Mycobacterium sp.]|nr:hypothetical protein [Mycobacterium sp.]